MLIVSVLTARAIFTSVRFVPVVSCVTIRGGVVVDMQVFLSVLSVYIVVIRHKVWLVLGLCQ